VRQHARFDGAGKLNVVPRQGRGVPGIPEGTSSARRALERGHSGQEAPLEDLHRRNRAARGDRQAGRSRRARRSKSWKRQRSSSRSRRPVFARRGSNDARGRPCAVAIWRLVPRSANRLGDYSIELDHGFAGRDRAATTVRARRRFCARSSPIRIQCRISGDVRWGFGCKIGVYAQHVYTTLPEKQTVYDYLRNLAAYTKKDQEVLEPGWVHSCPRGGMFASRSRSCPVASGPPVPRGIAVERLHVLILDEPGEPSRR